MAAYFFQERKTEQVFIRLCTRSEPIELMWAPTILGETGAVRAVWYKSPRSWPAHVIRFIYFYSCHARDFPPPYPSLVSTPICSAVCGQAEPGETIETICAGERSLPNSSQHGCTGR